MPEPEHASNCSPRRTLSIMRRREWVNLLEQLSRHHRRQKKLKVQNKELKPELDIDEEATDELMPVNIESDDQSSIIVHMDELIEQEEWCETYKDSMEEMMKLYDM